MEQIYLCGIVTVMFLIKKIKKSLLFLLLLFPVNFVCMYIGFVCKKNFHTK